MLNGLIKKATDLAMWICTKTGRVFEITGTGGPDDVYLIRYYVIKSRFVNVFIHQFLRSDRDDLHDHPWNFATYLVRGAYTEQKWNEKEKKIDTTERWNYYYEAHCGGLPLVRNRLVVRKATDQHRVVVDRDLKREQKSQAALTICVTGPTIRDWGFVKEVREQIPCPDGVEGCAVYHTKMQRKWINWKKYLGLPEDAPSRG